MPRGLTKEQKLFAKSLFTELLDVRNETQTSLGLKLGCDQTTISRGRNAGTVSMQVLIGAARIAGRSDSEIAKVVGFSPGPAPSALPSADPKWGTFFMRLTEVPGLRSWLTEHPEGATVGEVWAAVRAYESTPTLSRSNDGQPAKGWESFFADLRAGRIGVPVTHEGDAAAVLALETSQRPSLPSTTEPKRRKKSK